MSPTDCTFCGKPLNGRADCADPACAEKEKAMWAMLSETDPLMSAALQRVSRQTPARPKPAAGCLSLVALLAPAAWLLLR